MEVKQIHEIMNTITGEVTGKTYLVAEDLSNIVDVGTEVLGSTSVDNYVHKLVDRIGRVVYVNRPYSGSVPSVLKDGWEYGSILEKITMDSLPEAQENDTWNLTKGQSYDLMFSISRRCLRSFSMKRRLSKFLCPLQKPR